ncbi:MBL fold metallo-hydrolase [Novosphingobium taihuense]|uniref:Ribonuclease BN (tRNA processing enzyme) n=1 Tax=Novosphingobium taihuense TaxID=260085 RepID=A0A7W7AA81_9SPHN|nr:ribonuclease BN (tRNA processing enzyme) [Novosphingobium taihuense]
MPTPDRSEPANLLTADDFSALVDAGDGTVVQLARRGLDLTRISAVFISHHHMDHTGGLPAVIGLRWMNNMPGQLTIYGPPGTREIVDGIIATMGPQSRVGFGLGLGQKSTPPSDSVRVVEMRSGDQVSSGNVKITAVENSHYDESVSGKADRAISLSYRFQLGSRSITYSGDTGPSAAFEKLATGTDLLVSEVIDLDPILASIRKTRPDMPEAVFQSMSKHLSTHHITPVDLGSLAAKANVSRLVLTHFAIPPAPLTNSEARLREGISRSYSGPVDLAIDLQSFDVACK